MSLRFPMVGIAAVQLALVVLAFCSDSGEVYRHADPLSLNSENSRTREALRNKIYWVCAVLLLGYAGVEVSLRGWLVTSMLRVRRGTSFVAGMIVTGFCKHAPWCL